MSSINRKERMFLKSELKGPQYEIKAVAREQFPVNYFFSSLILEAPLFQRTF